MEQYKNVAIYLLITSILFSLLCVLLIVNLILKKIAPQDMLNTILVIANFSLVIIALNSLRQTKKALEYSHKSNERSEKLHVVQNKPMIDVTPICISQRNVGNTTSVTTSFSIYNYSGFKALNIRVDLKYGDRDWIVQWKMAYENANKSETSIKYDTLGKLFTEELDAGKKSQGKIEYFMQPDLAMGGVLDLEKDVCNSNERKMTVKVRTTYQNEFMHVFDQITEYKLICTKAGNGGKSFTFIQK